MLANQLLSQSYSDSKFGASVGLLVNLGSHQNSIGLNVRGYYTDYFYQVNAGTTFTFNGSSYGNRKKFFENRTSIGAVLLAGKKESERDFELDGLNHQSKFNYGLGFNYLLYFDNVGTSQLSGGWGIHVKNVSLRFENDVFGGQARDRFRTGHIQASYKTKDFKFSSGLYIWTGETRGSTWQKIPLDKQPSGFRILEDLPYGKTSHGVLYGGLQINMPYGNVAHLRLGVDSENIRHGFQNRFAHDLIILPKKMERNTPHYPRLDEHGCPTFDPENVRKSRFFMQFGMNDSWGN